MGAWLLAQKPGDQPLVMSEDAWDKQDRAGALELTGYSIYGHLWHTNKPLYDDLEHVSGLRDKLEAPLVDLEKKIETWSAALKGNDRKFVVCRKTSVEWPGHGETMIQMLSVYTVPYFEEWAPGGLYRLRYIRTYERDQHAKRSAENSTWFSALLK